MNECTTKVCKTCQVEKPTSEFYKHPKGIHGVEGHCRTCKLKKYKDETKELRQKREVERNKKLLRDGHKTCMSCQILKTADCFNKRSCSADGLAYYCKDCVAKKKAEQTYKDRANENKRMARKERPNEFHKRDRERYLRSRERIVAQAKKYREKNPERVKANKRRYRVNKYAAPGDFSAADVRGKYELQGGVCYYCKTPLGKSWHLDHKIPLSKGGSNWPSNLCCACPNCNLRKNARPFWDFLAQTKTN